MDRRQSVAALVTLLSLPFAQAEQMTKVWRIGFLGITSPDAAPSVARVDAFRAGLRELGYVEGKNFVIDFRWAGNDYGRLPGLADELVRQNVDVLVTYSTPGAMAAKKATAVIPIVLASVADPVSSGIVASLGRPGGNITGLSLFTIDEAAKRLELLKDAFPHLQRVAVLINPANAAGRDTLPAIRKVGAALRIQPEIVEVRAVADLEPAFAHITARRAEALVLFEDPLFTAEAGKIAALAMRHRLPSIGQVVYADAGGLIGNGTNQLDQFRRAAGFVDKILRGAKPADLPVQQASRFELIVNMNAATALGITIPKQLLFRADRVIE